MKDIYFTLVTIIASVLACLYIAEHSNFPVPFSNIDEMGVYDANEKTNKSPSKILDQRLRLITLEDNPVIYHKLGKLTVDKINGYMPKAAIKLSQSPQCDKVELVNFSSEKSLIEGSDLSNILYYADCSNGNRIYTEVFNYSSEKALNLSYKDAVKQCIALVVNKNDKQYKQEHRISNINVYQTFGLDKVIYVDLEIASKAQGSDVVGVSHERCEFNDREPPFIVKEQKEIE